MNGAARTAGRDASGTTRKATFRDVFAIAEFRALWLAQLLSVAGDQLARVAMTVLVYDRTHSPLWTAVTYAVTFLPWVVGGLALSGLADRLPRREVMVTCDVGRMVLVCLMVLVSLTIRPALALWAMVALLFCVTLLDSPFKSARSALMPDILTGERYVLGTAVSQTTFQIGMVAGFALGGLVVAFLGVRQALVADAATFAVSALLIRRWVRRRPAAAAMPVSVTPGTQEATERPGKGRGGVGLVMGNPRLRTLMLFGWLVTFYVVPMGVAAPYAADLQSSLPLPVRTGLIFAAVPLGTAIGAVVFGRLATQSSRQRLMGPMAIAACGVLLLCLLQPAMFAALLIIAMSGAFAAYQLAANAAFVSAVPRERRGQAFGLANGGMQVAQGLWFVAAGAAAGVIAPAVVIAASGGLGAVLGVALTVSWRRCQVHGISRESMSPSVSA